MKKKIINKFSVVMVLLTLIMCGCGAQTEEVQETEETQGTILDNKFVVATGVTVEYASVIKFSDGDLVQIVDTDPFSKKSVKTYGTYKIDGHELTISISGYDDVKCVILEEKNCISINGREKEILDETDNIADEEIMNMFD